MPFSVLQLKGWSRCPNGLLSLLSETSPQVQFPETEPGVSEEKPQIKGNQSSTPSTARRRLGTCSARPGLSQPPQHLKDKYLGLVLACPETVALSNPRLVLGN